MDAETVEAVVAVVVLEQVVLPMAGLAVRQAAQVAMVAVMMAGLVQVERAAREQTAQLEFIHGRR
jgi:hypothetical protein